MKVRDSYAGESIAIHGIDYVELYVGNARQAAYMLGSAYGFTPIAFLGLETGVRDRASVMLQQGTSYLVVTETLEPDSPIAEHVRLHGDSVKDIAFLVDDVQLAFTTAVERGATPVTTPQQFNCEQGVVTKATIAAFGDIVHSFIQRSDTGSFFLPNMSTHTNVQSQGPTIFTTLDHVAISLEYGHLEQQVHFYTNVLGFVKTHQEDIMTEYSGMNSSVVQTTSGSVKFPMQQPIKGKRRSQIEEFLAFHHGPGVQHLAFLSDDIVTTIRTLQERGIEFVRTPATYYDTVQERVGLIDEDIMVLRELNILVDGDSDGYLLQLFAKPLQSRPTLFVEIIQRKAAQGFGSGNIKALFAALEREQALRGNL